MGFGTAVGSVVTLLGLALVVIGVVLYTIRSGVAFKDFGITIDAGSSHSEVTLYRWGKDRKVIEIDSCKTHHGIDDYGTDTSKTLEDLLPCVEKIASQANNTENETPLVLGATAGMRLVEAENKTVADIIFAALDKSFKSLKLKNTVLQVAYPRTIPGTDEGLYLWISVNYLLKIVPAESKKGLDINKTVGTLDMGGASAQIAYEVASHEDASAKASLFDTTYYVESSSNLCYGKDQAIKRYYLLLIKNAVPKTGGDDHHSVDGSEVPSHATQDAIPDPCGNTGLYFTYSGSKLLEDVCTNTPDGKSPTYIDATKVYTFSGTADLEACKKYVKIIADRDQCSKTFEFCPLITKPPPKGQKFVAISSYYYVTRAIPHLREKDSITRESFQKGAESFCKTLWEAIEKSPMEICGTTVKFCQDYCFGLNFIDSTLGDTYHFQDDQWTDIHFIRKIDGKGLGWALGDMLVISNEVPIPGPPRLIPLYAMILILIAAVVLIVVGIGTAYATIKKRRTYESV